MFRKGMILLILAFGTAMVRPPAIEAETYYVDASQTDSGATGTGS